MFEQIRHYSVTDIAVSLRLMRALGDIASTVEHRAASACGSGTTPGTLPGNRKGLAAGSPKHLQLGQTPLSPSNRQRTGSNALHYCRSAPS
jgi:hypothetical protein